MLYIFKFYKTGTENAHHRTQKTERDTTRGNAVMNLHPKPLPINYAQFGQSIHYQLKSFLLLFPRVHCFTSRHRRMSLGQNPVPPASVLLPFRCALNLFNTEFNYEPPFYFIWWDGSLQSFSLTEI